MRTVDPIRNHATWYHYDNAGRVSRLWTSLSAAGPQYGLGISVTDAPNAWRCFSVMVENFVQRDENPDVSYEYDVLGRLVLKEYADGDAAGDIRDTAEFNWRLGLSAKRATVAANPETIVAEQIISYRSDMNADYIAVIARSNSRLANIVYDALGRIDTITTTVEPSGDYDHDILSRRTVLQEFGTGRDTAKRTHSYVTAGTQLESVDNEDDITESMDLTWDPQGRVSKRIIRTGGSTSEEQFDFGYHDRLINLRITDPSRTDTCTIPETDENSNYSSKETWTYRYSPSGHREQKRLMTSPMHDRSPCGVAPWTAYVRAPSGTTLAVYHGRQTSQSTCTVTGFGQYERRVHIYPVEFRSYGPDGINVIFERNNAGNWVKRFVTTDRQGSILAVSDVAGYIAATTYQEFGTPVNTFNRRSGWLDRERDYETSPLSEKHKLYDLDARKYDASTGQFLSVDPLWASNLHQGSYVYCAGDPVNMVDPWGLGEVTNSGAPSPGDIGFVGPLRPPMVTGNDAETQADERHALLQAWFAEALGNPLGLVPGLGRGQVTQVPFAPQANAGGARFVKGARISTPALMPHEFAVGRAYQFREVVVTAEGVGADWANALDFGLGVGEFARQGKVYEMFGRSAETVEKSLRNGQFVHTNGKTYSQGFRGNQYMSSKSVSNSLSTAKFARNLGRSMTLVGAGISLYQFGSSSQTGADYARLAGAAFITGSAFIPVVGPFISIGLGVADSFRAFDGIYDSFGP